MPKLNEMFPSSYLKSGDIDDDGDMILTVKGIKQEQLGQGADVDTKWVLYFEETD